ncbi:MAG: hypothetical protein ACW97X_04215, partial [Candidatus Hodarchaeales archaeon]
SVGSIAINLTFETINYTAITITLYFNITDRGLVISNEPLTTHQMPYISPTSYLQYGDRYYFYVFINDSENGNPLDIEVLDITPSTNVTFENVSSGSHLFYFDACIIARITPTQLTIQFDKSNYVSVYYQISFFVDYADSEILFAPTSISTNYTQDVNFSVLWQSIRNPNSPFSPILRINSTNIGSSLPIILNSMDNGNYSFVVKANRTGVFDITIFFYSPVFENQSFQITINLFHVPTTFSSASIASDSIIGQTTPFYYSEQFDFSVTMIEEINGTGLQPSPFGGITYGGNGSFFLSPATSYANGTHFFSVFANDLGLYQITIGFNIPNYESLTFVFYVNISEVPTYLSEDSTPYNEVHQLYYTENHTFSVIWLENLSDNGINDPIPDFTGNGSSYLTFDENVEEGNHTFTLLAEELGYFQISIVLEIRNHSTLVYQVFLNVSIMPTLPLNLTLVEWDESILVEETLSINGYGYQNFKGENISEIDTITMWMNSSIVSNTSFESITNQSRFAINFTTEGYQWGRYNLTIRVEAHGYQSQFINFTVILSGREITLTVQLPVETIEQGQSVEITAILEYAEGTATGLGAGLTLASLSGVEITYIIGLNYQNGSTKYFEETTQTDILGEASYVIDGQYTGSATGFANITVIAASSLSGLSTSYSMSEEELAQYKITQFLDPFEILIPAAIILITVVSIIGSVYTVNRRRKVRIETRVRGERKVEQSFEDIKSIRLILARHESGLQFYSEKTIAELTTDTDALSGMSAAISSFMEEVSDSMASRSGDEKRQEIEMMSREGLHMMICHGMYSSLIIISEVRLPDYFQDRLKGLGKELESKFSADLQNFYSSDQIPSSVVKKMVREFIPLHYFSAFILNEGVLTLDSIKLTGTEKKMLKEMKQITFLKGGVQFFFSEQIISQLSKDWKRSEAIKFLDKAIDWNLLIEASQEDLLKMKD